MHVCVHVYMCVHMYACMCAYVLCTGVYLHICERSCLKTYDSFGQWTSSSMSAAVLSLLCDICSDVSIGRHPVGRGVWSIREGCGQ